MNFAAAITTHPLDEDQSLSAQNARCLENVEKISAVLEAYPQLDSLCGEAHSFSGPAEISFLDHAGVLDIVGREDWEELEPNRIGGFDAVKILHGVRLVVRNVWVKPGAEQ